MSRDMKGKNGISDAAFLAVCILLLGVAAPSARAGDASHDAGVVASGGEKEKEKECCTYLGVFMEELTARAKEKADYTRGTGVVISNVAPGGPAEAAGIEGGDICYLFDGVKVEDPAHLASLVQKRKAGDKITIVIYRDGKEKKLPVTLGHRPKLPSLDGMLDTYKIADLDGKLEDARKSAERMYFTSLSKGRLGMALLDLDGDLAPYFGVKEGEGVLVTRVEKESPAAEAGLKGGDVITAVNGAAVGSFDDVSEKLADLEEGDRVSLDVLRKGIKKSYELEADKGFGENRIFIAPFGQSKIKIREDGSVREKDKEEALKLKMEMKALQERLQELEERLGSMEKK